MVGTALWRDSQGFGAKVAAAKGVGHQEFLAAIPDLFGMASRRITS